MSSNELPKMTLLAATKNSAKGKSPSLYISDNGTYFVQGFTVDSIYGEAAQVPSGETIVRVDKSLLEEIAKQFT